MYIKFIDIHTRYSQLNCIVTIGFNERTSKII